MIIEERHIVGRHEEISVNYQHEHGSIDDRNTGIAHASGNEISSVDSSTGLLGA